MKQCCCLLLLFLGYADPALPQRIGLKHYSQSEGLSNQVVAGLLQDHTGFIWVGTENGLFRYDGRAFTRFDASDGLRDNAISSLHLDIHDNLWVGTPSGITRYAHGRFIQEGSTYSAGWYDLGDIASDSTGRVYFGTPQGLGVLEPTAQDTFKFHVVPLPGLTKGRVYAVVVAPDESVWFSSDTALYRLTNGRVEDAGRQFKVPTQRWSAIVFDRQGAMWIRSNKLLMRRDPGQADFRLVEDRLVTVGDATQLGTTNRGDVLVPSGTSLLMFHPATANRRRREVINQTQGLPEVAISCVLQDREGSIWLGSSGGGLYRWLGYGAWQSWTRQEGLSDSTVWQMLRDSEGTLWAATQSGLNTLEADGKRWHRVIPAGMPSKSDIRTIFSDKQGLWLGLNQGGLWRWDRHRRAQQVSFRPEVPSVTIRKLAEDNEGTVWAATNMGLFRVMTGDVAVHFERPQVPFEGSAESFYDVLVDRKGRVWAAGENGVSLFDHGKWRLLQKRHGLAADDARCLTQDHEGRIWISYDISNGLTRLTERNGGFASEHFINKGIYATEDINFLGCDKLDRIWSGTDNGLDVLQGTRWSHYGTEEGLGWLDTDSNGFWADEDGSVWIGTSGGVSHFRPGIKTQKPVPPGVAITSVTSGGKQLSLIQPFTLPYGAQPLEIGFSGLTYVNGDDLRFRYRLCGLDDKWSDTSHFSINYSHLAPGRYNFELYSISGAGTWSRIPANLRFAVLTPLWMTVWFRLFVLLTIAAAAALIYCWRIRSINLQNQRLRASLDERTSLLEKANTANLLKTEFLANMSHEIRTPLHGLMAMVQLTLDSELTDEQRENLLIVHDSARSLHSVLSDVLDLSKIEANCMELERRQFSLPGLLEASLAALRSSAKQKNLQLSCTMSPALPPLVVGDSARLRQVVTNLIGNAIKFTNRGGVSVSVALLEESRIKTKLQFEVEDSGIGVPPEAREKIFEAFTQADGSMTRRFGGTGLGLSICAKLVLLMGGEIRLESEVGKGSTFIFTAVFGKPQPGEQIIEQSCEEFSMQHYVSLHS